MDVDRGWQVLCAAGAGQTTGEYENRGLLTGLLLDRLERVSEEISLATLEARVVDRFAKRSRAWLGGEHGLFSGPAKGRREFLLVGSHALK
jgi:hypothetical protein